VVRMICPHGPPQRFKRRGTRQRRALRGVRHRGLCTPLTKQPHKYTDQREQKFRA
jgi:hypothetical protein